MRYLIYGLCFLSILNSAHSTDDGMGGAGGAGGPGGPSRVIPPTAPCSLQSLFPDLPFCFPLETSVFSGKPPYEVKDFPSSRELTLVLANDAPIPLPLSYAPLVDILQRVQDPTLTFEQAKPLIESQADLILTLYKPVYGKPDPRLYMAVAGMFGAPSLPGFSMAKGCMERLVDEDTATQPDAVLDFPLTWQFVTCHLKTFEEEKRLLETTPKSDAEKAELKKPVREQKHELRPLHSSAIAIYGLYGSVEAVFETMLGHERNAPRDFFEETNINILFRALSLSEKNPCPPQLTLATHKLLFMIYFNFLLVDLYELYHAHMEGLHYHDNGTQLFLTSRDDYPKPFREVCSRMWEKGGLFWRPKWNIFHHVNAMLPHIVYVDYS